MGYGYIFNKYFKNLCGNKWENYIYNLICVFNNLQDFEKGNGIKSNYKNICLYKIMSVWNEKGVKKENNL